MKLSPPAEALFRPLPAELRATASQRYFLYLSEKEGRLDARQRTLARRERFFRQLTEEPVRARRPIDAQVFHRNHNVRRPEEGLPDEILWLLAVAKANRTECYGMERHIVVNGILDGDAADTQAYVDMQEVYHTRILLDVLRCFDLDVRVQKPAFSSRIAVDAMVHLPNRFALPLILGSELVASVVFRLLLETGRDLFGADEPLWERVSALLEQIMIDEVGHVTWCRARLGGGGLLVARTLLPVITASLLSDVPEVERLVGAERFRRAVEDADLARLSEGCGEAAFVLEG